MQALQSSATAKPFGQSDLRELTTCLMLIMRRWCYQRAQEILARLVVRHEVNPRQGQSYAVYKQGFSWPSWDV